MKVFDLHDQEGKAFAFEVENVGLGRRGLCRVVRTIPGVQLLSAPRFLSWFREETFCTFLLDGVMFAASEPFGDNSRYWVGPHPARYVPQIALVRLAFANHTSLLDRPVSSFFGSSRES